jgi:tetratricopeptide (TPR) repeat protein
VALISCGQNREAAKKRFLARGNQYYARGKYKEASIMYRNALQKDRRYGLAYYRLALTDLKLERISNAVDELRRAIELIPNNQPEHIDSQVHLADIYLAFARDSQFLSEVEGMVKELLQRDPNSYDGHRLTAELDFARAKKDAHTAAPQETEARLTAAIAEYRLAMSIKTPEPRLKMQLARVLTAGRRYPEAEQIYERLIVDDKTLARAYNELYGVYLLQDKQDDAERILKTGAANNPRQIDFLVSLAGYYSHRKRHDDMVAALNRIKAHTKDFARAYFVVGDFYFRSGDFDQAFKEYTEGMAADAQQKASYRKRMIEVLMRQNRRAEAADINAAILKDNPKDTDARGLRASLLLDRGDVQQAISELEAVVNATPDNFVARYNLGRAHVARSEWEQARQQFTEAIRQRPDYMPARLALAQLQTMRSEFEAAGKSVADILRIDKNNGAARMIEAAVLMGEKKYGEAHQLLETVRETSPDPAEIDFSLGSVALKERNLAEAERIFRRAYAARPDDTRNLVGLVETLAVGGHFDQAIPLLQAELAKNPARRDLQLALGNIAVRAGNFDLAVAQFQAIANALDKNSQERGDVALRLGIALRHKGDLNGAIQAMYKAKDALPANPMVADELALTLQAAGRKREALEVYGQAIKLDPRDGVALNNLAFLMADGGSGDLDMSLTYAQRARQALPNLSEVADTLGWIYLKKNMSDDAMDVFRGLVDKMPRNTTYRFHLGMAYAQKGDRPNALRELEQALHSGPPKDEENQIKDLINKLQA